MRYSTNCRKGSLLPSSYCVFQIKELGLGTDQVVKESLKVKNATVYSTWFLLATPLIQKYLINIKKARMKMIGNILRFVDGLEGILRKESNRENFCK